MAACLCPLQVVKLIWRPSTNPSIHSFWKPAPTSHECEWSQIRNHRHGLWMWALSGEDVSSWAEKCAPLIRLDSRPDILWVESSSIKWLVSSRSSEWWLVTYCRRNGWAEPSFWPASPLGRPPFARDPRHEPRRAKIIGHTFVFVLCDVFMRGGNKVH